MTYKLVVRDIECTADSDPTVQWTTDYVGVIDSTMPSEARARIMWDSIVPPYRTMCSAINDFIHDRFAEEILKDIEEIERGVKKVWEEGTEAYIFWITREGVAFEFQYGEHGPEKGGDVTLAQFKLAVQIYLQFLQDPERRPIEVSFPE